MNFKIYLRSSSNAMVDRQKKIGRTEMQKIEYLKNKKSFVDEIKSSFHSFWRAIIWWKNKNLMNIADTRFKLTFGHCHQFGIRKDQLKKTWIVQKAFFFSKGQLGIILNAVCRHLEFFKFNCAYKFLAELQLCCS